MTTDLILGTAGHIDHGKTSLIKALTGIDTDRLPEEKKRGITIELGFAELAVGEFRLGIVDVPGHERFVRNMLAGATGMDLAMLVVAADDSVKPQTREHFEILRILDLPAGVIALTKCDLADPEWVELVEAEIRELVRGSFLEQAPVVRTSTVSGEGIPQLRSALRSAAEIAARRRGNAAQGAPFRMAVDRTFTVAGHGTVVTGSVQSGAARMGDQLVIEPGGMTVRVRGLQNHDRAVDTVHRGQRAAINLAGIHHDQLQRGHELTTSQYLVPSKLMTVQLQLLRDAPRPLKHRARIRFHVGTAQLLAVVSLLSDEALVPGTSGYAQLYLEAPAVATWGQPFIVRSQSPVMTLGGGVILEPVAEKIRRSDHEKLACVSRLESSDPVERGSAALQLVGWHDWSASDVTRACGVRDPMSVVETLRQRGNLVTLMVPPHRRRLVHREVLETTFQRVERALEHLHESRPLEPTIDAGTLAQRFAYLGNKALIEALLTMMHDEGRLVRDGKSVALPGHRATLSPSARELLDDMVEQIHAGAFQPPTLDDVRRRAVKNRELVPQLASVAAAEGKLVAITADIFLHREHECRLRERLSEALSSSGGMTLSQIRDILNTTRKYAVPICEYLDRIGFTSRDGDLRVLTTRGNKQQQTDKS